MKRRLFKLLKKNKTLFEFYASLTSKRRIKRVQSIFERIAFFEEKSFSRQIVENKAILEDFLQHCMDTVPYYKNLGLHISDTSDIRTVLKSFPILTKDIIRTQNEKLISNKFEIAELETRQTGGSTGQPLKFYATAEAQIEDQAHHWQLYSKIGVHLGDMIIALVGLNLSEEEISQGVFWRKHDTDNAFGTVQFSIQQLNENTLEQYLHHFNELKPKLIRSYPSALYRFAKMLNNRNLNLNFQLKGINITSEVCEPHQKQYLENFFNTKVYNEYGNKELSVFCTTDGEGMFLKSSPAYGYVEVLDEHGEDVKPGETGKIITTGFLNKGMPFVRYDTGDLGTVKERSAGIITFSEIVGRNQDFLVDLHGEKKYSIGSIYGHGKEVFQKIKEWQIKQSKDGHLSLYLVINDEFSKDDEKKLVEHPFFKSFVLDFNYVKNLQRTMAGKQPFIIRETFK
ncbi:MAG: hypothetical protein AAGD88_14000 [Bacteroidota bacterium]